MKHRFVKVLPCLTEFIKSKFICIHCGETDTDSKECKGTVKVETHVHTAQQAQG